MPGSAAVDRGPAYCRETHFQSTVIPAKAGMTVDWMHRHHHRRGRRQAGMPFHPTDALGARRYEEGGAKFRRGVDPGPPPWIPALRAVAKLTSNRCHPGEGRDPVVETLAEALFPALDPGLRRDDCGLDAPSSPSEGPSVGRHAGVRPTDALGARRYEEGIPARRLATM